MTANEDRPTGASGAAKEPEPDLHHTSGPGRPAARLTAAVDAILANATPEQIHSWAACWVTWHQPDAVAYREREAERAYAWRIRQTSWDVCEGLFPRPARPGSEAARVQAVLAQFADEAVTA